MMAKYYSLLISYAMIGTAFCSTKSVLDDDLYRDLRKKAHKPCYERLAFDKENVIDEGAAVENRQHSIDYTADEVVAIDHKGETITIKKKKETKR